MPRPRNSPIAEATTPMTSVSSITERSTWRRVAPSVRSVASSRVRCAIVIEIVLKMTNDPTSSAMPPNTSRNLRMIPIADPTSFEASSAWASAVLTSAVAGTSASTSRASCACETPGFAATSISSKTPGLSRTACAVGTSKAASVSPPISAPPSLPMPVIR